MTEEADNAKRENLVREINDYLDTAKKPTADGYEKWRATKDDSVVRSSFTFCVASLHHDLLEVTAINIIRPLYRQIAEARGFTIRSRGRPKVVVPSISAAPEQTETSTAPAKADEEEADLEENQPDAEAKLSVMDENERAKNEKEVDLDASVDPRTPPHRPPKTARILTPPSSEERQREEGSRPRNKKPRLEHQATIELLAHVHVDVDADAVTLTLSQLWAKPPAPLLELVDAILLDPDESLFDDKPNDNELVQTYTEYIDQLFRASKLDTSLFNSLHKYLKSLQSWNSHRALFNFVQTSFRDTLDQKLVWMRRNLIQFPRAVRPLKVMMLSTMHLPGIREWSSFSDGEADSDVEPLNDNYEYVGFVDSENNVLAYVAFTWVMSPFGAVYLYIKYLEARSESVLYNGENLRLSYGNGLGDLLARLILDVASTVNEQGLLSGVLLTPRVIDGNESIIHFWTSLGCVTVRPSIFDLALTMKFKRADAPLLESHREAFHGGKYETLTALRIEHEVAYDSLITERRLKFYVDMGQLPTNFQIVVDSVAKWTLKRIRDSSDSGIQYSAGDVSGASWDGGESQDFRNPRGGGSTEGTGGKPLTLSELLPILFTTLQRTLAPFYSGEPLQPLRYLDMLEGPLELDQKCDVFVSFDGLCLVLLELLKAVIKRETDKVSASSRAGSLFRFLSSVVRIEMFKIVWDGRDGWRGLEPNERFDMRGTVKLFAKAHLYRTLPSVRFDDLM